jgi:hypothetical protein
MQASLLVQRVQTTSMGLVPMTEGVRLVFVHPKVERARVSLGQPWQPLALNVRG